MTSARLVRLTFRSAVFLRKNCVGAGPTTTSMVPLPRIIVSNHSSSGPNHFRQRPRRSRRSCPPAPRSAAAGSIRFRMLAAIATVTCLVVLIGAAVAAIRYFDRDYGQPTRDLSKMMSVRLIMANALSAHFKEHGSYPHALTELPLNALQWGDEGSSVRDVSAWSYVSEGSSFTMTWTNVLGTELFLGGRAGQDYYSRDEKQ